MTCVNLHRKLIVQTQNWLKKKPNKRTLNHIQDFGFKLYIQRLLQKSPYGDGLPDFIIAATHNNIVAWH